MSRLFRSASKPKDAVATGSNAEKLESERVASVKEDAKVQDKRGAHDEVQLKTFTRWWNSWLEPRGMPVTNLLEQQVPGTLGIQLIEALSGAIITRYNRNPKNRYMQLENQTTFLNAIKSKGLKLVNIGPEDLVGADRKLVLGLTWTLILRYEIQRYGVDELELLKWVKEVTKGYDGVNVTTWGESFSDGKAFAAICNHFAPHALDYGKTAALKPVPALTAAFECADTTFGVPQLLDPADVAASGSTGRADDKSLITYVAKLKQGCLALREAHAAELAEARAAEARAKRLEDAKATKQALDELAARASALKAWCGGKAKGFTDEAASPEVQGGLDPAPLQARLQALAQFRSDEKPPKAAEKAELARLHAEVGARLASDAAAALAAGEAPPDASTGADLEGASPGALQDAWNAMEAAEYGYEDALRARLAAAAQKAAEEETDRMAEPVLADAQKLLGWTNDKAAELTAALAPAALGSTPEEAAAKRAELAAWAGPDGEKEEKRGAKSKLQDALRELGVRRAQEGRDPLPPVGADLEKAWGDLEAANAALDGALADRERQLARQRAAAETDALTAEVDELARKWHADVSAQSAAFEGKVSRGELGDTTAATQRLLDEYRGEHVGKAKPAWAETKGQIEAKRALVDERRAAEGREPKADWAPTPAAMAEAWGGLLQNGNQYEQALLSKLGKLKAEEAARMQKKAAAEAAAATLAELLPPLVKRAKAVDDANERAVQAAKEAEAEQLPWLGEKAGELQALLANLTGDGDGAPAAAEASAPSTPRGGLFKRSSSKAVGGGGGRQPGKLADAISATEAALSRYADEERPAQAARRRALEKAVGDSTAAQQLQRYAGTPSQPAAASAKSPRKSAGPTLLEQVGPAGVLGKADAMWRELDERERMLRATLVRLREEASLPTRLWERLQRGCAAVEGWSKGPSAAPVYQTDTRAASEAEAVGWLQEAEATQAELLLQARAVAALQPLADTLIAEHPPFKSRAEHAIGGAVAVVGQQPALAKRIEALREEVARQRKLAGERLIFGAAIKALEASLLEAEERLAFPVDELDTAPAFHALITQGTAQADALTPPPEGASAGMRAAAEEMRARWAQLAPTLTQHAHEREQALAAQVKAAPLRAEAAGAKANLEGWYARCTDLLVLHAPEDPPGGGAAAVLALEDVERALALAEAQTAEGDSHARRLSDLRNEVASLGVPPPPLSEGVPLIGDGPDDALDAIEHVKSLATSLRAAVGAAPPKAEPAKVVDALKKIEEAAGFLTGATLQQSLPTALADFLLAHVAPGAKAGTLSCDTFNPFPLDQASTVGRPLPEGAINTVTHGHAILEHLNRARTDPKAYAASLHQALAGCFAGTTVSPPWGGRYQTQEGEAALIDLCKAFETAPPLPPLRLVPKICEVSQELADKIAQGQEPSSAPLEARLQPHGKSSGVGFEIIGMGVRDPVGVVAQMLLCDGDASRRNREFLFNKDVTVGGFGLAEHPAHGAVGTLTLLQLFATTLDREVTETCPGGAVPSQAFLEVLEAVPSAQVRTMASDALAAGKAVKLSYLKTAVEITIDEQTSRLEW